MPSKFKPLSTSKVRSVTPTAKLIFADSSKDDTEIVPAPPVLPGCNLSSAIPKLSVNALPDEGRTEPRSVVTSTSAFATPSPLCSSVTATNKSPSSAEEIESETVQPDACKLGLTQRCFYFHPMKGYSRLAMKPRLNTEPIQLMHHHHLI